MTFIMYCVVIADYFMDVSHINTLGHVLRVLETIFTKYDHPVSLQG